MKITLKLKDVLKIISLTVVLNFSILQVLDAQVQFKVNEVEGLFSNTIPEIFEIIKVKNYDYKGKEEGFLKFIKHTLLGDYKLTLFLNKANLASIGYDELAARGNIIIQDLKSNEFTFSNRNVGYEFEGFYVGCFYRFDNLKTGMMCTVLRSPQNENALWIAFGKIPSTELKKPLGKKSKYIFQGTKNFHDKIDAWRYVVKVTDTKIEVELFPGKKNSVYPNKLKAYAKYTGMIKNGKIIIDGNKSVFKYESGALYELNNEGDWNIYTEYN